MLIRVVSIAGIALLPLAAHATDVPDAPTATLVFGGDVMLAETVGERIAQGVDPFANVTPFLQTADATIANLECVVATKGTPMEGKPFTFRADPLTLPVLARHFRIVSLANNHTGDFGHEAFVEQLDLLKQNGISWFGGGRSCAEARTPHIIEVKGIRIALLAYNDYHPRDFEAGPDWPGVAWAVGPQIEADIRAARTLHHADLVIPFMHWGLQYVPEDDRQRKLARLMIRAGADAVVGGHSHVTQGIEYFRGKLIVYSLGNFVFNGFDEGPSRIGWLLRLRLDKRGLVSWDTAQYHIADDGIPHLMKDVASPAGDARKRTR
jgi:poly-gamma-glutamate capsule biosynthesis protein CapA/YwtB (metallophosphatase superfamily)